MKKSFMLFALSLCITHMLPAQQTSPVVFDQLQYSFGKIKQNVPVTTTFNFTNRSDKSVVIESAQAQCGCTASDYTKTAVLPGKSGTIKVTYNAAAPGSFSKTVTVKFAGINDLVVLIINGEVVSGQ